MNKDLNLTSARKDIHGAINQRVHADENLTVTIRQKKGKGGVRSGIIEASLMNESGYEIVGHGHSMTGALDMLAILLYYGVDPK